MSGLRFHVQLCSLLVFLAGCSPLNGQKAEVAVEEASQFEMGVDLEPVQAQRLPLLVDQRLFPSKRVAFNQIVQKFSKAKTPIDAKFYFVTGEQMRLNLKKKLGSQFHRLKELYESAVLNRHSMKLFPELNMIYRFKVMTESESALKEEAVFFPLKDALSGEGMILKVDERGMKPFWGNPKLVLSNENGLNETVIADLSRPDSSLRLYRLGEESWLGFKEQAGANLFLLRMNEGAFSVHSAVASLPVVPSAPHVTSVRLDPTHYNAIGSPQAQLNSVILFYADSEQVIKKIFMLDSQFLIKDLSAHCDKLKQNGLLPKMEWICSAKSSVDPFF